jgi:dTDP-4-dehydrorhamnose reductase
LKKYLILGASGSLGAKLLHFFPKSHGTFFKSKSAAGISTRFLDLTNFKSLNLLLKEINPDVVINCSGMTSVDLCEQVPEKCWKLNCWLPLKIAEECGSRSIKYVHISTDHFLNLNRVKLTEFDNAVPVNQYGFSKLGAETFVYSANKQSLIVRANFFHFNLHSPQTFLDHLIDNIKKDRVSHSFSDVFFTPISTFQLALYIQELVDIDFAGVVNISSSEILSKFEFHDAVLKEMNVYSARHLPALLNSIDLRAVRPHFMALDNNLLQKTLGVKVPSIYDMIKAELQLSK